MFACILIVGTVLWAPGRAQVFPSHSYDQITTCEEFEVGAHFNPYEIVDSMWKIFYFWANTTEMYPIIFSLPAKKRTSNLQLLVEAADPNMIMEWERVTLFMEPRPGVLVAFFYAGTPGAFRALVKVDRRTKIRPYPLPHVHLADIRLKQIDRYIGMMCCEDLTAYVLARLDEMPLTQQGCEMKASKFNIKLPNGTSYIDVKRMADEL